MELDGVAPQTIEGPDPCEDCQWYKRCRAEKLACKSLQEFVYKGVFEKHRRAPSREAYISIFYVDEPPFLDGNDYSNIRELNKIRGMTHKLIAEKYDVIPRRIKNIVEFK